MKKVDAAAAETSDYRKESLLLQAKAIFETIVRERDGQKELQPALLRSIADAQIRQYKLAEARATIDTMKAVRKVCPAGVNKPNEEAYEWLDERPRIHVEVRPPSGKPQFVLDGRDVPEAARPLEEIECTDGHHSVLVTADGYRPVKEDVVCTEGPRTTLTIDLVALPRPPEGCTWCPGARSAGFAAGGAGVIALVTGAMHSGVLQNVQGTDDASAEARESLACSAGGCGSNRDKTQRYASPGTTSDKNSLATESAVFLVLGTVLATSAAILLISETWAERPSKSGTPAAAVRSLRAGVSASGVVLEGTF